MESSPKPWFARKKFGWGWGPASWQGWLVTGLYVIALMALGRLFPPKIHHTEFMIGLIVATVLLLVVSVWKSELRKGR